MKKIFFAVLLTTLTFQIACVESDDALEVGIVLFLVDDIDGPLENVTVTIFGSESDALDRVNELDAGETDRNGEIDFELEPGEYHFTAALSGSTLEVQIGAFTIEANQEEVVELELREVADVAATASTTNGNITIEWQFLNQIELPDGTTAPWTADRQAPYLECADRWLEVLTAIEGVESHTITIELVVRRFDDGNGAAGPLEETEIGGFFFPLSGEMIIGNHTYEAGFDPVEFKANILHEIGHILGFGYSNVSRTTTQNATGGMAFQDANSQAVAMYNEIYGVDFNFVPFSDDQAHLFDSVDGDDQPRNLPDGASIPPLTKELMANGFLLGKVTAGILDDLGYEVDYSKTDEYTP